MVDCNPNEPMRTQWVDGEFVNAFICVFTGGDPAMQMFFALSVFGAIGIGLFIYSGSILLPAVLGILMAGAVFVFLPPTVTNLAMVAGLLVVSIGGILLVRRIDTR